MFVSHKELIELTGYSGAKCQMRWLRDNGYRFEVSGIGKPKLLMSQLEERIGSNINNKPKKSADYNEAGLRKLMGI